MKRKSFNIIIALLFIHAIYFAQEIEKSSQPNGGEMKTQIEFQHNPSQPFIILPTSINNKGPFEFILDTGAGMSLITEELAANIGIEGTETKQGMGANGKKFNVSIANVESIAIEKSKAENSRVAIMKEIPKCVGQGVIGYNFLKDYVLKIDYLNNVLTFDSPSGINENNKVYTPFKIAKPDKPIILVDVLINKEKAYKFILDTGASMTVVSPELVKQSNVSGKQNDSIEGAGGNVQASMATLKSLSIGETHMENITVMEADIFSAFNQVLDASIDGIVGYNFLSNFSIELDYPNQKLCFEK